MGWYAQYVCEPREFVWRYYTNDMTTLLDQKHDDTPHRCPLNILTVLQQYFGGIGDRVQKIARHAQWGYAGSQI